MKKILVGIAGLVCVVCLSGTVIMAGQTAGGDESVFTEYKVICEEPVTVRQVVDTFIIPPFKPGMNFRPGTVEALKWIRAWNGNPVSSMTTWNSRLNPGAILRLPAEWVPRGIQGILEPVKISELNWNPSPVTGAGAWIMTVLTCLFAIAVSLLFGRRV